MRNRQIPMWETDEVETITKMLEQEVARRLTDEGVDLILEKDKFSKFDGYTERKGKRISVCEVKTRTEPLPYFEQKGSFLFDAAKLSNLLNVARLERLKAVLFVMTGDERLFFHSLKAMPMKETISARLNHYSTEYVEKDVCLIPLEEFTEIVPKVKVEKPEDIPFTGGRSWMTIEGRYRSEEILEYYRERKAIAMEDGGLCDATSSAQAERETSDWILSRLAESTDKLFKL
jgi:hypothetical protein